MPTYQYRCTNHDCGNSFELVQSFTEPAATACPVCGQPVRKVFGSVGVVFKGSGFYRTDSRADARSASTAATSSKSDAAASTTKTEGSTPAAGGSTSGSATAAKAAASA